MSNSTDATNKVFIFFLVLILLHSVLSDECQPVQQCEDEFSLSVGKMTYDIDTQSWDSEMNEVCPISDPEVPQWTVRVINSSQSMTDYVQGTFCTAISYEATVVCATLDGELVVQTDSFQESRGSITVGFSSSNETNYDTSLTIKYAPTGVYPRDNNVLFHESQSFITLSWYIYLPEESTDLLDDMKIYHNEQLIQDTTLKQLDNSKYQYHLDRSIPCIMTASGDPTFLYNLFVLSPTATSSSGEYVLFLGTHSATITLGLNPSPLQTSSSLSSSLSKTTVTIQSSSISSSFTRTPDSSHSNGFHRSSLTPGDSTNLPRPSKDKANNGTIILSAVLVPVFLIAIVSTLVITVLTCVKCKRHSFRNTDKVLTPIDKNYHAKDVESASDGIYDSLRPIKLQPIRQFSEDPSLHRYHHVPFINSDKDTPNKNVVGAEIKETSCMGVVPKSSVSTSSLESSSSESNVPSQSLLSPKQIFQRSVSNAVDIPINTTNPLFSQVDEDSSHDNISKSMPSTLRAGIVYTSLPTVTNNKMISHSDPELLDDKKETKRYRALLQKVHQEAAIKKAKFACKVSSTDIVSGSLATNEVGYVNKMTDEEDFLQMELEET